MSSVNLIDWILDLLGFRGPAGHATVDPDHTVMEVNPTDGTVDHFVVTPCGYRIRVPQPQDVSHSVGDMLPEVRQSLAQVPPLPGIVTELLREVQSANSTAGSVATVAASDPVLAAALLRTVNSSAMGLSRKITSVTEAVSYLGFGLVKSVLIRLRLDETLPTTGAAAVDAEDLWIHCLAVSYVAEVLSERVRGVDRGFVSTLGLLHDIGKLVMLSQMNLNNQLALAPSTSGEDCRSREARLLGTDHAGLGASLAHTWGLPSDLVQAIRFHHHPENAFEASDPLPLRQAAGVVFVANQLAKLGFAHTEEIEITPIPESTARMLGFSPRLELLMDRKVQGAITRAIQFAAENTKQNKSAVRRLLRLRSGEEAARLIAATDQPSAKIATDDTSTAALFATESDATSLFRAAGTTREADVIKLLDACLFHQSKFNQPNRLVGNTATMLRSLLPNLIDRTAEHPVEVVQQYTASTFTLGIRSDVLKFAHRISPTADSEQGAKLLASEFASVMNLGWVDEIHISSDGGALVLTMK